MQLINLQILHVLTFEPRKLKVRPLDVIQFHNILLSFVKVCQLFQKLKETYTKTTHLPHKPTIQQSSNSKVSY